MAKIFLIFNVPFKSQRTESYQRFPTASDQHLEFSSYFLARPISAFPSRAYAAAPNAI